MAIKMMSMRAIGFVGLLCAAGCARSYVASGLRGEFDLSGTYIGQAQPVTNACSEVASQEQRSRVDVQHSPREMELTLVFEGEAYPAKVQRDGKFASVAVQRNRGGAVESATMRGRFGDSTVTASLEVKRGAVRRVLPTSRTNTAAACRYHVNITGIRTAEQASVKNK